MCVLLLIVSRETVALLQHCLFLRFADAKGSAIVFLVVDFVLLLFFSSVFCFIIFAQDEFDEDRNYLLKYTKKPLLENCSLRIVFSEKCLFSQEFCLSPF